MRIGFTGAGATGKTTTLNVFAEFNPNIPVLPSSNRSVYKKWNLTEEDQEKMTFEEKLRLQEDIYEARFKSEEEYEQSGFVSDRTVLDNFCYQQIRCYDAMDQDMLDEKRVQVKKNMRKYDLICYFPITFRPVGDEIRYANPVFQNMMDNFVFAELHKMDLWDKTITVRTGTPEERAGQISNFVKHINQPTQTMFGGF
jgi:hypothetical protein